MEDGQDSDDVASVTDSEDEEQKAKDLDREEIFMFTGIQKCINLIRQRRRPHAPQRWPFTIPATCECR